MKCGVFICRSQAQQRQKVGLTKKRVCLDLSIYAVSIYVFNYVHVHMCTGAASRCVEHLVTLLYRAKLKSMVRQNVNDVRSYKTMILSRKVTLDRRQLERQ